MLLNLDNKGRDNTLDPAYAFNQMKMAEEKTKIELREKEIEKNKRQREMKITGKQWKIFYYMLDVSYQEENHFYVEKKNFNITKCCKILNIKSNQTFYLAIDTLKEKGMIEEINGRWIINSNNKINIDINVISLLIDYSIRVNKENNIDLLRTFYICVTGYLEEGFDFSYQDIISWLGYEDSESIREYLIIYFSIIEFFGLGNFIQYERINEDNKTIEYFKFINLKTHLEEDKINGFIHKN